MILGVVLIVLVGLFVGYQFISSDGQVDEVSQETSESEGDDEDESSEEVHDGSEEATHLDSTDDRCKDLTAPDAADAAKAKGKSVLLETDKGDIRFELYPEETPVHAANFIQLVECGFFDGTSFHRVEPGFVVQGGDPLSKTLEPGDPRLGTGDPGYKVPLEVGADKKKHLKGRVGMARSQDPNSAGSQFYFALNDLPSLDGQYTVPGGVTMGLEVVESIEIGDKIKKATIVDTE